VDAFEVQGPELERRLMDDLRVIVKDEAAAERREVGQDGARKNQQAGYAGLVHSGGSHWRKSCRFPGASPAAMAGARATFRFPQGLQPARRCFSAATSGRQLQ